MSVCKKLACCRLVADLHVHVCGMFNMSNVFMCAYVCSSNDDSPVCRKSFIRLYITISPYCYIEIFGCAHASMQVRDAHAVHQAALAEHINLRVMDGSTVSIAMDETTKLEDVNLLLK